MRQYDTKKLNLNFSLSGSHFEVTEGNTFTVTLAISGPDAKPGLQIPYRIVGTVRALDYIPNEEYGLFTIGSNLTATVVFTAYLDKFNESDKYFILALYYYPTIQRLTVIKNVNIPSYPKPAEPIPDPPIFNLVTYQPQIRGGTEAVLYIMCQKMRPGVKLYYSVQTNADQFPYTDYVYSESSGVSVIKVPTSTTNVRRFLRVWLTNHPKVESQIIINP